MIKKTVKGTDGREYSFVAKEGTFEELSKLNTTIRGHIPGTDSPFYNVLEGGEEGLRTWFMVFRVANGVTIDRETEEELVRLFLPLVKQKRTDRSILLYVE
ncbi:hypothetical protein [Thermotoga sp. SG1]|uniref:hypothetical protein n=1 Tax=Thermotoga sp. SG1 TaxID=126739 RepID=UPI001E6089DA|nr:hypothetical protein [Thermotoga sp. SG1]